MDDLTLQQLVDSGYRYPLVTEVFFDVELALNMGLYAIKSSTAGFDIVWDKIMLSFFLQTLEKEYPLRENRLKRKESNLDLL